MRLGPEVQALLRHALTEDRALSEKIGLSWKGTSRSL